MVRSSFTELTRVASDRGRDRGRSPGRSAARPRPRRRNNGMTSPTNAICPATVDQPSLLARRRARASREGDSSRTAVTVRARAEVGREGARHRGRGGTAVTKKDHARRLSGHGECARRGRRSD